MNQHELNLFILVYNRENVIPTLEVLHRFDIKDNIYLVVGSDDPKLDCIRRIYGNSVLVFDKRTYADVIDAIGMYRKTLKICTYARAFIDDYANRHNMRYICILFDDIESIQLRYIRNNKVCSTKKFNLKLVFDEFIDLLNSSASIYMTGPPGSSFYMGCNSATASKLSTHYGNMLIYDITKPVGPYKASVIEDMSIVLFNSMIGHIGIFPFGLQINCRPAKVTDSAYSGVSDIEYNQQKAIMTNQFFADNVYIPYKNFIPKIINECWRKV